jgi:hypothetical protein
VAKLRVWALERTFPARVAKTLTHDGGYSRLPETHARERCSASGGGLINRALGLIMVK